MAGSPNYTSPGNETFWNAINWTNVPLSASVAPGGGHTPNLLVKSANNGFDIYMLFRWNDSAGPAYFGAPEAFQLPNGTLVELTPELTQNVTQLFYNSTYYYPDRVAMLWFLAPPSSRQQAPVMMLGSDGAITGGAADIWHWQGNPTDNNPNDTGFPGGYTDPQGNPIYPPDNLSFAEDDYTNTSGFYVVAGNFGNSTPNLAPYADPFVVHVGSSYSYTAKTWTVEMVRSLQTSDASSYQVQLKTGTPYYVALAVWQGRMGESSNLKSVSQWLTLTISGSGPQVSSSTSTTSTNIAGEVSVPVAAAVAAGVLIAGLVIGIVIRSPSRPKK
ncbi:MAG: ethylbenzene dehydrogenase-related protein [Nitrososphaerales archaeon]